MKPFGRNPTLLNEGERRDLRLDFDRCFSRPPEAEDLYHWVRNTAGVWDRAVLVLGQRLDRMLGHDRRMLTDDSYSFGLDFNPYHVAKCHVADMLGTFLDVPYRRRFDAVCMLANEIADEWSVKSGVRVSQRIRDLG